MKTIATINFKGGVGKTTTTWALGKTASVNWKTLLFDLDAQMSLTQSIALNEAAKPFRDFEKWYATSISERKTIFDALDGFVRPNPFQFDLDRNFIYNIDSNYHFIPSAQDLYWAELDLFDKEKAKHFIQRLLEKIEHSEALPDYKCVFFDCPPSFSLLSYSVLSCCDLVLIPINPDFFAARGITLLLEGLKMRVEPFPVPKIGVFMNKAKKPGGNSVKKYSNETQRYLSDASFALEAVSRKNKLKTRLFDTTIPDRVGVKRAIQEGLDLESQQRYSELLLEAMLFLGEDE